MEAAWAGDSHVLIQDVTPFTVGEVMAPTGGLGDAIDHGDFAFEIAAFARTWTARW